MDLYDIIKSRFFEGRKPAPAFKEDWLDDGNTPFFLNSSGSPFQSLNLKHLCEAMGTDVTAYSFRRIISTWALSHRSEEIRNAEEEALQHSLRVAKDAYLQNKQLKPQTLTQAYVEEECILPKKVREEIRKSEMKVKSQVTKTEDKRQKRQLDTLIQEKEAKKQLQQENKPLGARHRVLEDDRKQFGELIEELTGENIQKNLKERKPLQWRNFFVKNVCSADGKNGEAIRNIWTQVYQGDLKWGVRDARWKAEEKHWPRRDSGAYLQNQDRNSWIASSLLKSFQTASKAEEKKSYMKQL